MLGAALLDFSIVTKIAERVMEDVMEKLQKHLNKEIQQFLQEQNQCPICRNHLDIYVENIPSTYSLREEARCQSCMALSRVENHIVH